MLKTVSCKEKQRSAGVMGGAGAEVLGGGGVLGARQG